MVNPYPRGCLLGAIVLLAAMGARAQESDPARSVDRALGKAASRWYDPVKGTVRPVLIPIDREEPASSSSNAPTLPRFGGLGLGNILPITLLVVALLVLVAVLVWYWREYKPTADGLVTAKPRGPGGAKFLEELPAALRGSSDPWQEAVRLRDRGELGLAVVQLFAHQLLTLSRLGLVRLAPGRTGRQLVRAVTNLDLQGLTTPTLRSFESFYYGHHAPTEAEFATLWATAEAFERQASAVGVAS